jgi:cytochrome c553
MKFSRILGVAAAVLVTTAVAQQVTPSQTTPAQTAPATPAMPAPEAAPQAPASGNTPATTTAAPEATAAPVVALADAKPATWGDAKAGQTKAGACAACHGLDGNSADPQYPKLAGQHETYIWRQLKLFKSGERTNPIMQGMAAPLSEQDMRDIGAYFATQHANAGVADDTAIASGPNQGKAFYQVGERIFRGGKRDAGVPACQACHGPVGRGIPGPTYPSIGGQHAGYTAMQLKFFRDGGIWGKDAHANPIMSTIARNLSDEEIQALATYVEGLHAASAPTPAK